MYISVETFARPLVKNAPLHIIFCMYNYKFLAKNLMSHNKKNLINQHITLFNGVLHQFVHALYSTRPTNVITESVFNKNGLSTAI